MKRIPSKTTSSIPLRSMIVLAVLIAGAALPLSHHHAQAASTTFTVNSLADTDDSTCDLANCTLREALNAANSNLGADTIEIIVTGNINLTGVLPDIAEDVTINGPGANLLTVRRDTGGEYRIFNMQTSGVVTFFGLTISNGRQTGISLERGGGISNDSDGTLNVNYCTLDSNTVYNGIVAEGGAIFNGGGTLNLTNSLLINNYATSGGGVYNFGGTANITNSTFNGNSAGNDGGGGIFNYGAMTVDRCIISNSINAYAGGGILNLGMLDVTNSTLSNNSVTYGGGIANIGILSVTNSTLSGNSAVFDGGAIYHSGNFPATITSSTLSNNSADNGGGISKDNFGGVVNLDSSIVALNTATTSGPDIFGVVTSQGHNVVGNTSGSTFIPSMGDQVGVTAAQLNLGPLQNNGGATETMALGAGSIAIDKGDDAVTGPPLILTTDQRGPGYQRKSGAHVDAGAFERQQVGIGPPTNKDQCKNGGWTTFTSPHTFKNQGDCIQFVNTGK